MVVRTASRVGGLDRPARSEAGPAIALAVIVLLAFGLRLFIGMLTPLDGDESVEGIAALHILRGKFVLMESSARYLGALDSYILAPFIALFGPSLFAIRFCLAVVGAGYVALTYLLGRLILPRVRDSLLLGAIAAVFPFFALFYGMKARTYGVLLLLEVLCLILAVRLAWAKQPTGRRGWAIFGLVGGLSVWHDVLLVIPLAACAAALLLRGSLLGWARLRAGLAIATVGGIAGFSPWLLYNATTRLGSLRHLYAPLSTYSVSTVEAARQVLHAALPIFVGAQVDYCGPETVPAWVVDLGLALLATVTLWLRRAPLTALMRGRVTQLAAVDFVLLIAPLSLIAVTARWFNALSCEPRYLMPLAVPLALAITLVILGPIAFRAAGLLALAACVGVSGLTLRTTAELIQDRLIVPGAPVARLDLAVAARALESQSPEAIWAQYWLARPVEYFSGDRLLVGEYGGYVGFPEEQTAALAARHPGWLFVDGDPMMEVLKRACAERGITYVQTRPVTGLTFFADLSQPLTPFDLGIKTQSVQQAE